MLPWCDSVGTESGTSRQFTVETINTKNTYGMLLCSKGKAHHASENWSATSNHYGNKCVVFEVCPHELYLDYSVNNWPVRIKSKYSSFLSFTIHETLLLKKSAFFWISKPRDKNLYCEFLTIKKKNPMRAVIKKHIFWYPTTSHDNSFLTITHTFRTINITKVT